MHERYDSDSRDIFQAMTPDEAIQSLPGDGMFNDEALQAYERYSTTLSVLQCELLKRLHGPGGRHEAAVQDLDRVGEPEDRLEELVRQPEDLAGRSRNDAHDNDSLRRRVVAMVYENWTDDASNVASDAILDMLDGTIDAQELLGPLLRFSDYWLEQIARSCFGLPSDDSDGDWQSLLEQIDGKTEQAKWAKEGF